MTNILLLLAVLGMVVGVYAVAMPTLVRRGWRLPFAGFFADSDDAEDEPFVPVFEAPRVTAAAVSPGGGGPMIEVAGVPDDIDVAAVVEPPELLPPVPVIDLDAEEDDPTRMPLFEGLDAPTEIDFGDAPAPAPVSAEPPVAAPAGGLTFASTSDNSPFKSAAPASGSKPGPKFNTIEGVSAQGAAMSETTPQPGAEAAPNPLAEPAGSDDMMSLFAEDADAGKGPNIIYEAVGDVTIDDLMEEVRALRAFLDKRAA